MLDSARAVPWQTWLSGCLLVLCTILVIDNYSNGSKQSMFIVHPAGPADSDTGSSEGHSAQSVPLVQHIKHLGQRCTIESVEYISSTVEQEWIDNADTWDDETAFCREKARRADEIETLARLVTEMNERAGQPDSAWDAAEGTTNATVLKLLSRFNYKLSCGGKKTTVVEWIEPLYGGLRHPKTYCGAPDEWGLDRGYLLLTDPHTPRYHPQGRHFLFDLGASTFTSGLGGASQSFMIKAHGARGIQFDRILLWEADMRITDEQIFGEVPPELLHAYQYFHMPAAADATSPGNPLQILKKIAKPEDFVAFKMDIDNGKIENALVEQIMADPELVALVDEFYFEHHVNWGMMLKWWVTCIDPNKRLVDSYKMYKKMRTMGIRAHGWP